MTVTEYQVRFVIASIAFIFGVFVGYALWHRARDSKTLTSLQILSMGVFFAYLAFTTFAHAEYSDLVAVSILAMTGGEPIGKVIAKITEKTKK